MLDVTEDRQQLLVNVTGITTLCLRCINPVTTTTDTLTSWVFPDQPTLDNGEMSTDGLIRIVNGTAEITNPQTRIIDGFEEYEVACLGPTYDYDRVELYTNSKFIWAGK